jgi:hypothetical protein
MTAARTESQALAENLIYLVSYMLASRRLQIPHGRFHIGVTEPLLNSAQIDPRPETSGSERSSEFVQPKVLSVELCALCYGLQTIEEVELGVTPRSRENERTSLVCFPFPSLQAFLRASQV